MTSKPSLKISVGGRLVRILHRRTKAERRQIGALINSVRDAWGQPHLHRGIGIRQLQHMVYECRVDLHERLVFLFIATPPELRFFFLGTHDEVKNLLKKL